MASGAVTKCFIGLVSRRNIRLDHDIIPTVSRHHRRAHSIASDADQLARICSSRDVM